MTLGQLLRAWRVDLGLSQGQAAERAEVSQAAWCQYERDEKLPRVQQAVALAELTKGHRYAVTVQMVADAEKRRDRAQARSKARVRRTA